MFRGRGSPSNRGRGGSFSRGLVKNKVGVSLKMENVLNPFFLSRGMKLKIVYVVVCCPSVSAATFRALRNVRVDWQWCLRLLVECFLRYFQRLSRGWPGRHKRSK